MKTIAFLAWVLALASQVTVASEEGRQFIVNQGPPDRAALPFSDAVRIGNTLYIAGHLGIDPNTGQAPKDPATEVKLVMSALEQTVASAGMRMDEVASLTVYCTDLALYDTFNAAYKGFFHGRYPARAFIGVASLLRGAHFEVQGTAIKTTAAR